ncbi:hypothetical protein Tco_0987624 [Tanacetum coccineum]
MTKRAIRISQSKALSPVADETAPPTRGDKYGEAFPIATSLDARQDRENIPKTSVMPHELFPRAKIQSLEDAQKPRECVQGDAPNRGGIDQREVNVFKGDAEKDSSRSTDKGSESTGDLANVLSSMGAANILASGGLKEVFTTASLQVPPVSSKVSTAIFTTSEKDPTADVLTTARDTTPYTRRQRASRGVVIISTSPIPISIPSAGKEDKRKGKEIMTEPENPAKAKVQEQMSLQLARELQEEFVHEDQSIREQIERDAEIARIHAEEDLRQMINELDRKLINSQKNFARIKKYQAQQQSWESILDFVPMDSRKKVNKSQEVRNHLEKSCKKVEDRDGSAQAHKRNVPIYDWKIYMDKLRGGIPDIRVGQSTKRFEAALLRSWKMYKYCKVHLLVNGRNDYLTCLMIPNGDALRKCILKGPYTPTIVTTPVVPAIEDSPAVPEQTTVETDMNITPENRAHFESENEAIHLILTGIGDEIYSTVDACQTAQEMWEAIETLQQGKSLNIQDVKTNLFWEFGQFTSHDEETIESYYTRFYKMMNEMIRNNLTVATMQVNVQFLQQLQPEWSRFVTIVKQQHKLDEVSYHKLFDILKQYQKEVNELCAERMAKNANPLALVATAQTLQDPYYQSSKPYKSYAPTSKASLPTRSHATTRYKGKEIAKPITPPSELASEEDSDPEQVQRDKDMYRYIKNHKKIVKKTGKHEHENQKSTKRSQRIKAEARKVKPQSNPVKMLPIIEEINGEDLLERAEAEKT